MRMGAEVKSGCILYHQMILGFKGNLANDGFPLIEENRILRADAKVFGPVKAGKNSNIGANVVLTESIKEKLLLKCKDL